MLEVSTSALATIRECLLQKDIIPVIRISVMSGSCSGPNLRISLDEEREDDCVFDMDGIKIIVNKELLATCGSIQMDHSELRSTCSCSGGCGGFRISGEKSFLFSDRCRLDACDGECDGECK
jgi:Fe-S cluster assembly iron-binding protein IscA